MWRSYHSIKIQRLKIPKVDGRWRVVRTTDGAALTLGSSEATARAAAARFRLMGIDYVEVVRR